MAYEEAQVTIGSLVAGADLSSYQYSPVKLSASLTVNRSTAGSDKHLGILQNKPASGQAAEIAVSGVTKARIGQSVTYGQILTADSSSDLVPTTTATDVAVAIALETISLASTPTGDEFATVLLLGPHAYAANAS